METVNEDILSILSEAEKFANDTSVEVDYSSIDLKEVLELELLSDSNDTISLFYEDLKGEAILLISGRKPRCYNKRMSPEEYLEICNFLQIKENRDSNISRSFTYNGVSVRVFAITQPFSPYPNITISTSKEPPATWGQIDLIEILKKIMDDNFIIVGASGAGKTYLLNYMLKEKHKKSISKICLLEEFFELTPPNKSTCRLVVPPAKPQEERKLKYLTEVSNLMRLDYLYIGEIKGVEAWPFLINLSSGTKGAATVHGDSAIFGLKRIENLCISAGIPQDIVTETISKSIKYIIYVEKHEIKEIISLTGVSMRGNLQRGLVWSQETGINRDMNLFR